MNEQPRENPEGENENFEAVKEAMEKQKSILEQIDAEQKRDNPDKEHLETLMARMEVANRDAGTAWDAFRESMENNRKKEVAGE